MGNCLKEPAYIEPEMHPTAPRESVNNSVGPHLILDQVTGLDPPTERNRAVSPTGSVEVRSDIVTFERASDLTKSLENLTKQMDHSRVWQEAKFSHIMAETRLLEAKLSTMQRKSMDAKIPSHRCTPDVNPAYLALEEELEQRLDTLIGDMSVIKEEVGVLDKKAKRLSRQCSAY